MKSFLQLLLITSTAAYLFQACKKEDAKPLQKERYPLEYKFINEGDGNVHAAVYYTYTFWPNDSTDRNGKPTSFIEWHDQAFNDLNPYDEVTVTTDRTGYKDCLMYFTLRVSFTKAVYSPLHEAKGYHGGPNLILGMTYSRVYKSDTIQVNSAADKMFSFRWPSDTLKYKEYIY